MPYDFDCSHPAFKESELTSDKCRDIVLRAIEQLGICTDKQIAARLGWEINRVTPRRGELVESGKIYSAYKSPDKDSNRKVNHWAVFQQGSQINLFQ